MAHIVRLKNNSGSSADWVGQTIADGEYHDITNELDVWRCNNQVFTDVGNGNLIVNDGSTDFSDPVKGWNWVLGDTLPYSKHLEGKLAVHASSKPEPTGVETFAVWTGSGDDVTEPDETLSLGAGELLAFNMTYGNAVVTKDVKFDPRHGGVWIHEAYVKFENGGVDDYLTADIIAPATPLQQAANLDLVIADNWVTFAPGGTGTGTHGFGGTPILIPRPFSKDGDWDYDGTNLTPNMSGTGGYKISDIERVVSRYFNKIPLYGTSATYFTMSSEETAELPVSLGFFIRINVHNVSNSNWNISIIMEIYRERTICP